MSVALQYNLTTGEPFLRLPPPFSNIIITPPRMSDVEPSVAIMDDPAVAPFMGNRLGQYTPEKAERWLAKVKAQTDAVVEELRTGAAETGGPVSGCPVRHIREERADGTEVYIGDVGLVRSGWPEVHDVEERTRLASANNALPAGDPNIAWHIGYYLAPSHHGRGLMTVAVKTMMGWGIAWLKARYIRSSAFEDNPGSQKVLLKNGFVLVDTLVEHVQVGDTKKTLYLIEWTAPS
ncbi:GNAT domain-containing protein [Mycena alexandri]|uniref:GNAT domain-containing protein n=1 Tax=Mycena alexandri TaxID=1745969 RepID=A0AAD6X5Q4_9AGAR|nr:GNAT domain-containing protein [Mycena alexandri]